MHNSKLHPTEKCPEHGYRFINVDTDSALLYEFKCPLRTCFFGIEREEITREGIADVRAQD